ncbi:uncharacterized protein LOC124380977 isoform X2 [Silurus meridionalis]|uniref:uncharacterized protein LOC124380977 isoform X2 n=1 Tax=Silurus meridionalis TaxID=175797 RepID=UPI001EEA80C6|nr:uncharacterized protein LOC124380977 isoform X2 [Silurus meridionalis]
MLVLLCTMIDVSDTGLYYCSYIELDAIIFSNSSYIYVKEDAVSDGNETLSVLSAPKDAVFSAVFMTLTVISGVINVIMIPLCVMIFIIHKQRTLRGSVAQDIEEKLSVKQEKRKKQEDDLYTCVVYQNSV